MTASTTVARWVPASSRSGAPHDAPLALTHAPPALTRAVRLTATGPALWRVIDRSGRVIGHLQAADAGAETRYRARRFHAASGRFRELGEFWAADDAVDCLLYSR